MFGLDRFKFYQVDDSTRDAPDETDEKVEEVVEDVFGDDDEKKDDKDEDDEDKDEGTKRKGKDEKDLDTLTRFDYKTVKGEFPEIFKKYPAIKEVLFREQSFTEIFPTVEEAQKAANAQAAFEEMSQAVIEGNAEEFISNLSQESKAGLESFSNNFLPALQKTDKNLYLEIVSPVVSQFIKNVYEYGKKEVDEKTKANIMGAAKIVRRILFGGDYDDIDKDFTPIAGPEKTNGEDKAVSERLAQRYGEIHKEVSDACYGLLNKEIDKGLGDLKDRPGLKKMLARQIKEDVLKEMDNDRNYIGRMDNLWKRERRNGFSGTLKSSFTTTFMGKAKTLIPKLRSEARREALGKGNENEEETTRIEGGTRSSGKGGMNIARARKENLDTKGIFDAD